MICENIEQVKERITEACDRMGRDSKEVTLIAVSKTKPVSAIYEVMETGIIDYGENKVQELTDKIETISEPLNWHMIGHLQRNKVKYIVDKVKLITDIRSSYTSAARFRIRCCRSCLLRRYMGSPRPRSA